MARYLIETRHTAEQCLGDLDSVAEQAPSLLQRLEWGCGAGVHMGWAVVEAASPQEVSREVPSRMRERTRVVELRRFTPAEIRGLHEG